MVGQLLTKYSGTIAGEPLGRLASQIETERREKKELAELLTPAHE
jgi:hypothetical protein